MASVSRRSTAALVVCCGVLLASQALLVSVPMSAASGGSCSDLRRWAQSYKDASPSIEQLARYDRSHRSAIFNTVKPQVRSALWQEQLRRFDQRPDLTVTQHALIAEARGLMTPALYNYEPAAMKSFDEFWSRADKQFMSPTQRTGWFSLISTPVPDRSIASMLDKLVRPFVANAQTPWCECNTAFGASECASGHCSGATCNWMASGCGPGLSKPCNGMCAS
jgi:hypothetical protein